MDRPPPTAALESADDRLLAATHVDDLVGAHTLHDIEVTLDTAHVRGRLEREVVQVEACAEGLALAGQDDNTALMVHTDLDEEVVELCHLLVRHGVEIAGVVEFAHIHRTALLDDELFVFVLENGQMVAFLINAHGFHTPLFQSV